jgi:hypothetical protein
MIGVSTALPSLRTTIFSTPAAVVDLFTDVFEAAAGNRGGCTDSFLTTSSLGKTVSLSGQGEIFSCHRMYL